MQGLGSSNKARFLVQSLVQTLIYKPPEFVKRVDFILSVMTECYCKETVGGVFWIDVEHFQVVKVFVAKKRWSLWHTPEGFLIKIQSWASEILLHYNILLILLKI